MPRPKSLDDVRATATLTAAKQKPADPWWISGFLVWGSLTMTYFREGNLTIIGAVLFHCPVRDGKEWYRDAMVVRL